MAKRTGWTRGDEKYVQRERRDNLKRALKESKLSKSALARVLQVDVRTIRRQANGESAIDGVADAMYFLLGAFTKETLAMLDADAILKGR